MEGAGWYEWYDKQGNDFYLSYRTHMQTTGYFIADNSGEFGTRHNRQTKDGWKDGGVFSIVIPPPNVTGRLHIGHALTTSIQVINHQLHSRNSISRTPSLDGEG